MINVNHLKNGKIYIGFAVLAIFMILIFPREGTFPYEYQKGSPWTYETLIAPIDFPILKTESEMLQEKDAKSLDLVEYYNYDASIETSQLRAFNEVAVKSDIDAELSKDVISSLETLYDAGIVSNFNDQTSYDKIIFIKTGKRVNEVPASDVYTLESANSTIISSLEAKFDKENIDAFNRAIDLKSYIVPNLIYDENTSLLYHREAVDYISPTKGMVYSGQLIVSEGEMITAEIEQLLDSYKAEYKISFGTNTSFGATLLCHIIYIIAILALLFAVILLIEPSMFSNTRELIFILNLFALVFLVSVILKRFDESLLYVLPYAVFVMYLSAFFKDATVFPIYVVLLTPILLISENGVALFLMNLVAGTITLLTYSIFNRGWRQFINIIFIYAGLLAVYASFHLMADSSFAMFKSTNLIYLLVNAILVVVLYPFVFLFEKIFSFVSYSRLWDLSDTNNKLLDNLSKKAPGTFQHSLQVANLSATAAMEIGANSMLVRVGALYHDIGKAENPLCFIENQLDGVNYHQNLTPEESASEITHHVTNGVAMAQKDGLPEIVIDFIKSHHGKGQATYFYTKYCNDGGDPNNIAPFTYDGIYPQTKEQVILMIADSVEAASRTLRSYDEATITDLVNKIADVKMSEGQFAEAAITLKEIDTVKSSLIHSLLQIYHGRIAYPKRKK